jgi:hypothetical protein
MGRVLLLGTLQIPAIFQSDLSCRLGCLLNAICWMIQIRVCSKSIACRSALPPFAAYQANTSDVSRLHAMVIDPGSSNGTFINGRRIHPDIIALGALQIQFLLHDV